MQFWKNTGAALGLAFGAFAAGGLATTAVGDEISDFYGGNEVDVLIGYGPGGGYDAYARLLARHMGKHLAGAPTFVPENMPGGGSQMAASFVHSAAPKDGTVMVTFAPTVAIGYMTGTAQFDGRELVWIGSVTNRVNVCVFSTESGIESWEDMLEKDHILGGEGHGADVDAVSNMLINLFGTRSKLVTGYPGTAEMFLAIERGEIDGICGMSWGSTLSRFGDQIDSGKARIVLQAAPRSAPGLDAPNVLEFIEGEEDRQVANFILAGSTIGRPFATAPGTPPERVEALRRAFDATMEDAEFLAEAEKMQLEINASTGEYLEETINEIYETPTAVIDRAAAIVNQ